MAYAADTVLLPGFAIMSVLAVLAVLRRLDWRFSARTAGVLAAAVSVFSIAYPIVASSSAGSAVPCS